MRGQLSWSPRRTTALIRAVDFDLEGFSRHQLRQRDRPLAGKEGEGGPALVARILGAAGVFDKARQGLGNGDGLARFGQFHLSLVDAAVVVDDRIRNAT